MRIREERGISRKEFAAQLEIPYTTLRNYETDQREPGHKVLVKMATILSVSVDELIGYHPRSITKAPPYSSEAMKLAADYDELDRYGKNAVRAVADVEKARCVERAQSEPKVERLVYVNPAAAGSPLYAESDFERLTFPESDVPPGADFGIRISGRSMEPTVPDGCIAWVHKTVDLNDGAVGIFMLNDSATCKRYFKNDDGTFRLESDNPGFGPVPVNEFDTIVPVGEVIGTV